MHARCRLVNHLEFESLRHLDVSYALQQLPAVCPHTDPKKLVKQCACKRTQFQSQRRYMRPPC